MFEEDAQRPKRDYTLGQNLDALSVAELDAIAGELKAEIERVEAARTRKAGHLSAADALFARR